MTTRLILLAALIGLSSLSPAKSAEPVGRWSGEWVSSSTGHQGPLRARIRQVDSGTYRALFAGRFAKVIPFIYPSTLRRIPGSCNRYQSATRMPLLGEYRMNATISSGQFQAIYHSKNDTGIFRMKQR